MVDIGKNGTISITTVDGINPASHEVGSLSHYLPGFIHLRWSMISSINSTTHFVLKIRRESYGRR